MRGDQAPPAEMAAKTGTDLAIYTRERPGMSAFVLEDGVVYHTYSTYARGMARAYREFFAYIAKIVLPVPVCAAVVARRAPQREPDVPGVRTATAAASGAKDSSARRRFYKELPHFSFFRAFLTA